MGGRLGEVICVASGCTDQTVPILTELAEVEPRLTVMTDLVRRGKARALSSGLTAASGDLILVESADTLPGDGFLKLLSEPFDDPTVGLACAHPFPVDNQLTWSVRLARALWTVHDEVSIRAPNAGEAYMIRGPGFQLPSNILDDDAFVGIFARRDGSRAVYVRSAVVHNHAPLSVPDYLRQRLRIHRQAASLSRRNGMRTSTKSARFAFPSLLTTFINGRAARLDLVIFAVCEIIIVGIALVDRSKDAGLEAWTPISSTKREIDLPGEP